MFFPGPNVCHVLDVERRWFGTNKPQASTGVAGTNDAAPPR